MGYDQMGVFLQQGIGVKQDRKAADLAKDEVRAACYKILSDESDEDKTKKFSNINIICPLPPQKMPGT